MIDVTQNPEEEGVDDAMLARMGITIERSVEVNTIGSIMEVMDLISWGGTVKLQMSAGITARKAKFVVEAYQQGFAHGKRSGRLGMIQDFKDLFTLE